ncbi:hypothetical protein BKA80DRAFT_333988 [Phyllosticta citrichinensis]
MCPSGHKKQFCRPVKIERLKMGCQAVSVGICGTEFGVPVRCFKPVQKAYQAPHQQRTTLNSKSNPKPTPRLHHPHNPHNPHTLFQQSQATQAEPSLLQTFQVLSPHDLWRRWPSNAPIGKTYLFRPCSAEKGNRCPNFERLSRMPVRKGGESAFFRSVMCVGAARVESQSESESEVMGHRLDIFEGHETAGGDARQACGVNFKRRKTVPDSSWHAHTEVDFATGCVYWLEEESPSSACWTFRDIRVLGSRLKKAVAQFVV